MRCVQKSLYVGALLASIAVSPAFAQSAELGPARAVAIHECNVQASAFGLATWGNWQIHVYRECMAKRAQTE